MKKSPSILSAIIPQTGSMESDSANIELEKIPGRDGLGGCKNGLKRKFEPR